MNDLSPEQLYDHVLKYVEKRLGTNGVTTAGQLDAVCKEAFKSEWAGVFSADRIPTLNATKCKAIYNADRHDEPGSHWMALYYQDGKTYSYDSYGRNLKNDKVYKNLKRSKRLKLKQSQEFDAEQTEEESNCGARCISFLALAGTLDIKDLMKI